MLSAPLTTDYGVLQKCTINTVNGRRGHGIPECKVHDDVPPTQDHGFVDLDGETRLEVLATFVSVSATLGMDPAGALRLCRRLPPD